MFFGSICQQNWWNAFIHSTSLGMETALAAKESVEDVEQRWIREERIGTKTGAIVNTPTSLSRRFLEAADKLPKLT